MRERLLDPLLRGLLLGADKDLLLGRIEVARDLLPRLPSGADPAFGTLVSLEGGAAVLSYRP